MSPPPSCLCPSPRLCFAQGSKAGGLGDRPPPRRRLLLPRPPPSPSPPRRARHRAPGAPRSSPRGRPHPLRPGCFLLSRLPARYLLPPTPLRQSPPHAATPTSPPPSAKPLAALWRPPLQTSPLPPLRGSGDSAARRTPPLPRGTETLSPPPPKQSLPQPTGPLSPLRPAGAEAGFSGFCLGWATRA